MDVRIDIIDVLYIKTFFLATLLRNHFIYMFHTLHLLRKMCCKNIDFEKMLNMHRAFR
jgi:hypothetical protein